MADIAQRLIDHAALNGPFSPSRFLYDANGQEAGALAKLAPLCHEVVRDRKILWRMHNADRAQALRSLAARPSDMSRCWRKRGPKKGDKFAQVLERCIRGKGALRVGSFIQSSDEDALHHVREAISAAIFARPLVNAKRAKTVRAFELTLTQWSIQQTEQMRLDTVLPHDLCGRAEERTAVLSYLEGAPAMPPIQPLAGLPGQDLRTLLLTGSPGMGKSAFLADLTKRLKKARPKPWVVSFDFDQTTLAHGGPVAWAEETTRKLAQQAPGLARKLSALRHDLARDRRGTGAEYDLAFSDELLGGTSELLATMQPRPMIILLDTIEEVVAQNGRDVFESDPTSTLMFRLLEWIRRLAWLNGSEPVHAVYSGRSAPPVVDADLNDWFDARLSLPELDDAAASELLKRLDRDLSAASRAALVEALGGHPLHLIIVVKHLQSLPDSARDRAIAELAADDLRAIDSDGVIRTLYSRFLDRLRVRHLPAGLSRADVKALAHPGLLLRQVSEDILATVVAPAVGVDLSAPGAAKAAFRSLRDQVWLVTPSSGEMISHRKDVRRVMLPMMLGRNSPVIDAVFASAITHYEALGDEVEVGYLRALQGDAAWLQDRRLVCQNVVALAGQDELELLQTPVRAILKYHASQSDLTQREIATLPDTLALDAFSELDHRTVKHTGMRAAGETARYSADVDLFAVGNAVESDALPKGLSDRRTQKDFVTAFQAGDFEEANSIGWNTLKRIENWPDFNRPLDLTPSFPDHWLWLLTLTSMAIASDDWQDVSPVAAFARGQVAEVLSLSGPLHPDAGAFDFEMLAGSRGERPRSSAFELAFAESNHFCKASSFRHYRLLASSALARSVVARNMAPVRIELAPMTLPYLAEELRVLASLDEPRQARFLTMTVKSPDKKQRLMNDLVGYWSQKEAGEIFEERLYRDYRRADVLPTTNHGLQLDAGFLRMAPMLGFFRGQTPELHETVAALLANAVPQTDATGMLRKILRLAPIRPQDAFERVSSVASKSGRDRHDGALELVRFIDLCGNLPKLTQEMADATDDARIRILAKLMVQLDLRWKRPFV